MSEFDDFLKKKEEEIKAQREANRVRDEQAVKDSTNLGRLSPIEWAALPTAIMKETNGKIVDGAQFTSNHEGVVTLGKINLVLTRVRSYLATYRTFTPNGLVDLDSMQLTPVISGKEPNIELLWNVSSLNYAHPLSTNELAISLTKRLVELYSVRNL